MFQDLLLFVAVTSAFCEAQQIIYTRPRPLASLYPPVSSGRRMITDERLRLPVSRYFPQVETEVESAPLEESYYPIANTYRLSSDGLYAVPEQFVEQQQRLPIDRIGNDYFSAYDYDNEYAPVYASYPDELYAQPPVETPKDTYDEALVNYLLREVQPSYRVSPQEELFQIQRRDHQGRRQGVIPISSVMVSNGKQPEHKEARESGVSTPANLYQTTIISVPITDSPVLSATTSSPSLPESEVSSGSQKQTKSDIQGSDGMWRSFPSVEDRGQKEFPLFRPAKNSHQSLWSSLEEQLSRAKNSNHKSPMSLMEKLIQSHRSAVDPLQDQLDNLKTHKL